MTNILDLPKELIIQILTKLPITLLLKFRLVSKSCDAYSRDIQVWQANIKKVSLKKIQDFGRIKRLLGRMRGL